MEEAVALFALTGDYEMVALILIVIWFNSMLERCRQAGNC